MKKFAFPLGRVMDWRRTQARIEESKLERLYSELRSIDARKSALYAERTQSEASLLAARSATGSELAAFDTFRRFTVTEQTRLERLRADCAQRIAAQIQILVTKRRDVRLLERLKDDGLKTWQSGFAREIDAQADEAYLAKWSPNRR